MRLSTKLAKQIAARAHAILDREILLADTSGHVLAGHGGSPAFVAEALNTAQAGRQVTAEFEGKPITWTPFVYDGQTIAVFGLPLDTGPIAPEAIALLQGLAEVIVYQYFLIDRIQSLEIMRSDFIRDLLTAPQIDAEDFYRRADILQLNLRAQQAVIVIQIDGFERDILLKHHQLSSEEQRVELNRAVKDVIDALHEDFKNSYDNQLTYFGHDTFVLLKGIRGDNLTTQNTIRFMIEKGQFIYKLLKDSQLNHPITIGIGQYYPDLGGLRKSYQDASLALLVGSRVWGEDKVYHIKQVGMFITLANASQGRKAELAHQILSPLVRDEQLFKTVKAFLGSGLNLTNAAEHLHVHRNTLIYRLDKTKKLIGLDPRHFDDALQIKLGLMFYQED